MNKLRKLEISLLFFSAATTIMIMLHVSRYNIAADKLPFYVWTVAPYISYCIISFRMQNRCPCGLHYWATFITSLCMFVFTAVVYIDAFFIHLSSTSVLVFIFVPLYLLLGAPLLTVCIIYIGRVNK